MNLLLSKHRPKDESKEEFAKMWNNLGYSLSALAKTISELTSNSYKTKEEDFSIPNHYALLAFEAGKRAAYKEIYDLLPDTSKNF